MIDEKQAKALYLSHHIEELELTNKTHQKIKYKHQTQTNTAIVNFINYEFENA